MFPLQLQVQTQTKYKNVIALITSHLGSLSEKLHNLTASVFPPVYDLNAFKRGVSRHLCNRN